MYLFLGGRCYHRERGKREEGLEWQGRYEGEGGGKRGRETRRGRGG